MPCSHALFEVTVGRVVGVPANNDCKTQLAGLGLVNYTDRGAGLGLTAPARLTFEFVARKAAFNNGFESKGVTFMHPGVSFVAWDAAQVIGSGNYPAGRVADWTFIRGIDLATFGIGTQQFGIFIPNGFATGSKWKTKVLYLGLDDTGAGPDDDHDDLIIRVTGIVPEPATWAMLIAGFGMIGFALRRRQGEAAVLA